MYICYIPPQLVQAPPALQGGSESRLLIYSKDPEKYILQVLWEIGAG